MGGWRRNLLLVAALAAAAAGCAQSGGARRGVLPAAAPAPMPQQAAAGGSATARPARAEGAGPAESGSGVVLAGMESEAPPAGSEAVPLPAAGAEGAAEAEAAPPAAAAGAADAPKLTLEYLSRLALENHPLLRRDRARIEAAEGQALQAGLYPNPRFDTNNPQVFNGQNTLLNAGFQQEFVVKGKLRLDRAAALRAQQQSELALVQDRYGLLAQVRNQFYQTLAAQYRVDVLNRLLIITDAGVKAAKARVEGTIGDEPEVKLLSIDYDRTRADLENAQRVLEGERKQLASIVGFPGLVNQKVIGSLEARPPEFDEQFMERFATSENAQVQIQKLEVDKNQILLKRAEVEPYPNITLGPAYQYGLNKQGEQYWMTIVFPIPTSDRNQGNIKSARANIRDSVETLGAVQLELLKRLADSFSAHRGALEQAEEYRTRIIPDAREALRLVKSGYDAGLTEFAVFYQAQRTVIDATKEYVDILERVWTTAADLSGILQMDQFP